MTKNGKISGSDDYIIKCLNCFSGRHNFLTITPDFSEDVTEVDIDLHWPSDNDDITSRKITLE